MDSELADITHKMLPLDSGENAFMKERLKYKEVLLQVESKVEQLLQDVKTRPKVSQAEAPGIRITKIRITSFNGNIVDCTSSFQTQD